MKGRGNYLCLHRFDDASTTASAHPIAGRGRRHIRGDRRVVARHRDRRPRRDRGAAGGPALLERHRRDERELHRHRVPALRRLLRRRGCASAPPNPTSSSSTITCCAPTPPSGRARSARSSRAAATRSSTRRTSSRTSRRSTSASRSATTGSTISCRDVERVVVASAGRRSRARRRSARATSSACATTRGCSSRRCRCCASRCQAARRREPRAGQRPDAPARRLDEGGRRWSRRSKRSKPTIALAKDVPEDVLALGAARRRAAQGRRASCSRADDPGFVVLPRDPRPRRVPARLADRRVGHRARAAARPDGRDGADVRDADRRRIVRLRSRPARASTRASEVPARLGVRLRATGDSLPAAQHARPARRRSSSRPRRARSIEILKRTQRPRVRAVHELREPARGPPAGRRRAGVSDPRPGHGAAVRAAARLQGHAACRAARDVELLAGRGRRRRRAQLRDHRQAAVRLARRSDHRRADRGHRRARRIGVRRVSDPAGDPRRCSRASAGCFVIGRIAACSRCSIRGCGRWATGGGSWRRCPPRR